MFGQPTDVDDIPVCVFSWNFLQSVEVNAVFNRFEPSCTTDITEITSDVIRDWNNCVCESERCPFDYFAENPLASKVLIPVVIPDLIPGNHQRATGDEFVELCRETWKIRKLLTVDNVEFLLQECWKGTQSKVDCLWN